MDRNSNSEIKENIENNVIPSKKRRKNEPKFKNLLQDDESSDFWEQMGLGMLSDESSPESGEAQTSKDLIDKGQLPVHSSSTNCTKISGAYPSIDLNTETGKATTMYNFCESVLTNLNDDEDDNVKSEILAAPVCYTDIETPHTFNISQKSILNNSSQNVGIYSSEEPKSTIRNVSLSKIYNATTMGSNTASVGQHKGRSPLAIVSNNKNNSTPTQSDEVNKKTMGVIADENFFLYKKRTPTVQLGEDMFAKLSDEMIMQILMWLPKKTLMRCSLVCRRFSRLVQDETLWTRLDLGNKSFRKGAIGRILSRGVVILRLAQTTIIDPIFESYQFSENEKDFEAKLQYLDLSMACISLLGLKQLLGKCRQLRKLSLEHVSLNNGICDEIAANSEMEALNLALCDGISSSSIRSLFTKLKKLQSLNMSWTSLNYDAVTIFVQNVTPNLLRLNIAGCRKTMTDDLLSQLVTRCPDLLELDISDCNLLSADTIKIVCQLQKLEYLSLSRCYNITLTSYLELRNLNSLLYLDVFGILSDQAIKMLQNSFPTLGINKFIHSSVARPTVGSRRTSIWGLRTRD